MASSSDPSRVDFGGDEGWLTADQVAEVLSIKRATVYAYVSRGLLQRSVAMDGRTSLFERAQVEELRLGRKPGSPGELRTILATSITKIAEGKVLLRGRDLVADVRSGASFPDVADRIWESDNTAAWEELFGDCSSEPELAAALDLQPLDRLRVAVALASSADPFRSDLNPAVVRRTGPRLIKSMIDGLPMSASRTRTALESESGSVVAGSLWARLTEEEPTPAKVRCLDATMALLADHELAASTFAARVAASTRADPYSVVSAGLGALGGPLHGAASAGVHAALKLFEEHRDTEAGLVAAVSSSGAMAGFGHTIYRKVDPRYDLLVELVTDAWSSDPRLLNLDRYQRMVAQRTEAAPNVDLGLGLLTYLSGMRADAGEVIFAVSRTAGWIGHAMEEYQERPLRLRPKGHYVGRVAVEHRSQE